MDNDFIRKADSIINAKDVGMALQDLRDLYLEEVALTAMTIYDEYIKVGFTEGQAFDIAKSYTLEFCGLEWQDGEYEEE